MVKRLNLPNLQDLNFLYRDLELLEAAIRNLIKNGSSSKIIIAEGSDRLQPLSPFSEWDGTDFTGLPLLIKAKGKCTTDHISMAGFWLKYRGHLENISNNYMIGAVNYFNEKTNLILNQLTGSMILFLLLPEHIKQQVSDQLLQVRKISEKDHPANMLQWNHVTLM